MNRYLLNHFTTLELGVIIIGGFVVLALAGLFLVRRFFPSLIEGAENDVAGVILGVLAAIYGIVLAFVIVSLFEDFRKAGSDVRTEATALWYASQPRCFRERHLRPRSSAFSLSVLSWFHSWMTTSRADLRPLPAKIPWSFRENTELSSCSQRVSMLFLTLFTASRL